jgi:hypothetical protein
MDGFEDGFMGGKNGWWMSRWMEYGQMNEWID